jgi:hypothetical protein
VVAELVANSYDADAENVRVELPLGTELAKYDKDSGKAAEPDPPWTIQVTDDGHGMTPAEAKRFCLDVGRDRRLYPDQGPKSREKTRSVLGRKGIGKLAPFGVCRVIEILSSGGPSTKDGYYTTHFYLDFDRWRSRQETLLIVATMVRRGPRRNAVAGQPSTPVSAGGKAQLMAGGDNVESAGVGRGAARRLLYLLWRRAADELGNPLRDLATHAHNLLPSGVSGCSEGLVPLCCQGIGVGGVAHLVPEPVCSRPGFIREEIELVAGRTRLGFWTTQYENASRSLPGLLDAVLAFSEARTAQFRVLD